MNKHNIISLAHIKITTTNINAKSHITHSINKSTLTPQKQQTHDSKKSKSTKLQPSIIFNNKYYIFKHTRNEDKKWYLIQECS